MGAVAGGELSFHDLHRDFDPELFGRFYREVLLPSFDRAELSTAESIEAGLSEGGEQTTTASVALGSAGNVLGGITAEWQPGSGVLLVGYLAARPDARGRGIGGALVRRSVAEWEADETVDLALGEVHDPRHWAGVESDDPSARLRFFARHGAELLDVPFTQPALGPQGSRVPGFLLISLYVDPHIAAPAGGQRGVLAQTVSRFVRGYYEEAEGAKSPYDPELASLLSRIERNDLIRLLPVSGYERIDPAAAK